MKFEPSGSNPGRSSVTWRRKADPEDVTFAADQGFMSGAIVGWSAAHVIWFASKEWWLALALMVVVGGCGVFLWRKHDRIYP